MDVLLFEASYGEGHRRAAQAVEAEIRRRRPDLVLARKDFFEMVSPLVSRVTREAYVVAVRHLPMFWYAFYRGTERIGPRSPVQRLINHFGRRELYQLLRKEAPRLVVNTFPTPAGIISDLLAEGRVAVRNAVVITDHAVHSQWLHPGVDRYYVGAEEVKAGMVARGIPADKILVTGIPVAPEFQEAVDVAEVRRELGLRSEFVVLFMAGAYGLIGGFDAVVRAIAERPLGVALVVVTGRDEGLQRALRDVHPHPQNELVVLGFRQDIHRLMASASILVSKAGGLTTSEAMARGLPMLVFRPIPGQEEENVKLVLGRGAGLLVRDVEDLARRIGELKGDRGRLAMMRERARALGRPRAAEMIAEDLVGTFC
jgi:processive 1,2-diacylglycerol beta-glucosyltransferase